MIYVSTSEAILIKRLDKAVDLKSFGCTQITYSIPFSVKGMDL